MDDSETFYAAETLESAQYLVQEFTLYIYLERVSHIQQKINPS